MSEVHDEITHKCSKGTPLPLLTTWLCLSIALSNSVGCAFVLDPCHSSSAIQDNLNTQCRHERPSCFRNQQMNTFHVHKVISLPTLEAPLAEQSTETMFPTIDGQDFTKIGGLKVPTVGIGTISWSSDSLVSLKSSELQSLVSEAMSSGAPFFDTAERYGGNAKAAVGLGWGETENLIRELLLNAESDAQKGYGNKPIIATKFTPSPWRTTAESVVEACEQSCRRLGVEQIDLYQLHMPDIVQPLRFLGLGSPKDEVYWDGLAECYHRGLVKNVGVSNYGPTLLTKCQEALAQRGVPLASNQIAYSLIGRKNGAQETVDKCHELGIKVLAYYPFAMGLLTGKYSRKYEGKRTNDASASLTMSSRSRMELNDLRKYAEGDGNSIPLGGISPLLRVIEEIAEKRGKSVAQVALNYCICKGVVPIPGARTVAQLEDNLGAMNWRLSDGEVALLEDEADKLDFTFEGAGFKKTSEKFVGYGVEKWALD
eukprot:CAMPEP_0197437902 /NCGR_PEP_ID=MMETSP1175-20131217/5031_1 /TAXON_ID=1003142 /ORGANISM="Triceratium dubium, Strain CCMP147" /LENGTH=483 /DNA_ID=CAMNT_0042967529 /DNA_START=93 /DNA_END=1544 /DNA_ORIENTATION=+